MENPSQEDQEKDENQKSEVKLEKLGEIKKDQIFYIPGLFLLEHPEEKKELHKRLETCEGVEPVDKDSNISIEKENPVINDIIETEIKESEKIIDFNSVDKDFKNMDVAVEYDSESLISSDTESSDLSLKSGKKSINDFASPMDSGHESSEESEYDRWIMCGCLFFYNLIPVKIYTIKAKRFQVMKRIIMYLNFQKQGMRFFIKI